MTLFSWIAMLLAGGLGAVARLLVDGLVAARLGTRFPFGTLVINISGAFVLGLLTALTLPHAWAFVVGTGLLGAYTTFSTWMVQTHELAANREVRYAAVNVVLPAVVGLAAAGAGFLLGTAL